MPGVVVFHQMNGHALAHLQCPELLSVALGHHGPFHQADGFCRFMAPATCVLQKCGEFILFPKLPDLVFRIEHAYVVHVGAHQDEEGFYA